MFAVDWSLFRCRWGMKLKGNSTVVRLSNRMNRSLGTSVYQIFGRISVVIIKWWWERWDEFYYWKCDLSRVKIINFLILRFRDDSFLTRENSKSFYPLLSFMVSLWYGVHVPPPLDGIAGHVGLRAWTFEY